MSYSSAALKAPTFFIYCLIILGLLGCSHTAELTRDAPPDKPINIDYSIIYYIHADADYLFHDPNGKPVRANSQVLDTALNVAENARSGEVFIFYQQPEKKILALFPRKSSMLYHYTNGEKTTQIKYRYPDGNEDFLATEAQLYNRYHFHSGDQSLQNYFLYFGHEIPNEEGTNYHQTLPNLRVNTSSFTEGIEHFLSTDQKKFDLVVLSTCNNGTPAMAYSLAPVANRLLASPQNLHLSHIDTEGLQLLEDNPETSARKVAQSVADSTFKRLKKEIQTTITLAEYDLESVGRYINDLYDRTTAFQDSTRINPYRENVDCAQFPFFDAKKYTQGITTWYRPARFGRNANTMTQHSGWGCKPISEN
ncbi:hypothetical protein LQ318_08170 [Aliifodinibius salicampi]|uniref:Peptidase C13 family protein n=1 Tax=Fodinibius salicampi TaxID=1920655 RepID=A0ABT3PYG2_9BACT|nr:hypothetical protein [Fodinibius salicampi]MCW9712878.1 hypothetical protein [Fodinibius salicampi]